MTHPLQSVADELNTILATAGAVDAAGEPVRWTLDTDGESNSVGSWWCGTLGGVTDETSMRAHTTRLVTQRVATRAQRCDYRASKSAVQLTTQSIPNLFTDGAAISPRLIMFAYTLSTKLEPRVINGVITETRRQKPDISAGTHAGEPDVKVYGPDESVCANIADWVTGLVATTRETIQAAPHARAVQDPRVVFQMEDGRMKKRE